MLSIRRPGRKCRTGVGGVSSCERSHGSVNSCPVPDDEISRVLPEAWDVAPQRVGYPDNEHRSVIIPADMLKGQSVD